MKLFLQSGVIGSRYSELALDVQIIERDRKRDAGELLITTDQGR